MKLSLIAEKKRKKKAPKPEDFDERTACHMRCDLKHSPLDEDKDFFSYDIEAKDMWAEKIKEAQDKFDVDFSTENNDSVDQQRTIEIEQSHWDHLGPVKFACEMWSAGGDWEWPLRYFKCELKDGYASGISKYSNPHFVYIPNGTEGNGQLSKSDKGTWTCPDSDYEDEDGKRDEKKCWESLKDYLQKLVDDEIKNVTEERHRTRLESTCSRASQGKPRRYRQSVVLLGIPAHSQAQKLQHISEVE